MINESAVLNLYAITPRDYHRERVMMLVVAKGSERALEICRQEGMDWFLKNTTSRRIQRNVAEGEGVIDAVALHGQEQPFRDHSARAQ